MPLVLPCTRCGGSRTSHKRHRICSTRRDIFVPMHLPPGPEHQAFEMTVSVQRRTTASEAFPESGFIFIHAGRITYGIDNLYQEMLRSKVIWLARSATRRTHGDLPLPSHELQKY